MRYYPQMEFEVFIVTKMLVFFKFPEDPYGVTRLVMDLDYLDGHFEVGEIYTAADLGISTDD